MAERPTSSHLVIDGSNIATEGRSLPSLQQLDEAVRAFLAERPHDTWTVVVDATFGHRIEAGEKQMYEDALAANELVAPPAGTIGRGDKFLLEIANRADATVFSNDSFQEFHGEYEWLFDEGRLIGGKPIPEVGWIFTARTPVRGPKSRMASRMASERRGRSSGSRGSRRVLSATEPLPVPSRPPPRGSRRQQVSSASVAASAESNPDAMSDVEVPPAPSTSPVGRTSRSRQSSASMQAVNEPLPFIEFIAEHGPGSVVKGEVVAFTSHGAFVQVGDVRCYLALKLMGDPAPRSARDVLPRGEIRDFVVHALDAPRRGIDLALPGTVIESQPAPAEEPAVEQPRRTRRTRQAPAATEPKATEPSTDESSETEAGAAGAPVMEPETPRRRRVRKATTVGVKSSQVTREAEPTDLPAEERDGEPAEVLTAGTAPRKAATRKKSTTKKAPIKKAPAKKATVKKATAKKTPARRAATKRASAQEATESVPDEVATGSGPAQEQRGTDRVMVEPIEAEAATVASAPEQMVAEVVQTPPEAKKSTANEATARKATAKKPPAKKATAKKATAKKAAAKKAAPKKGAAAKKAPAKKAGARRSVAEDPALPGAGAGR